MADRERERAGAVRAIAVRVQGRVQGVWFRGWTVEEAQRRGLRGWVRNRNDGSVEALFIGADRTVAEMVAACRRGPPAARVTAVTERGAEDDGSLEFYQRPTK